MVKGELRSSSLVGLIGSIEVHREPANPRMMHVSHNYLGSKLESQLLRLALCNTGQHVSDIDVIGSAQPTLGNGVQKY